MNKAEIGAHIREARLSQKLTQEQLADKLGIGTTYISDIERGAKSPSFSLFINIINVLNVSADFILRGEIESGKRFVYNDIGAKLDKLNPKQRLAVSELIDLYIKSLSRLLFFCLLRHILTLFSFIA